MSTYVERNLAPPSDSPESTLAASRRRARVGCSAPLS
jgi:hypothetical protein